MDFNISVFYGPNKYASFSGVFVEFIPPFDTVLPADVIDLYWRKLNGGKESLWESKKPDENISYVELCASIALHLHQPVAFNNHERVAYGHDENSARSWMIVRYVHILAANLALRSAVVLTNEIFSLIIKNRSNTKCPDSKGIAAIRQRIIELNPRNKILQLLMNVALMREIPIYPTSLGSGVWLFGQGILGRHIFNAANDRDSLTGYKLSRNKVWANELIHQLGFPGVVHGVAKNSAEAIKIAARIGYPVVVKPVAGGMGYGVTTSIDNPSELANAFKLAAKYSAIGVIVERHVNGIDHRLAVFGGKLAWAGAKYPAKVIGDGVHSIASLIEQENHRRQGTMSKPIARDAEMDMQLAKNGLSYDFCPETGDEIILRTVANIAKGGTWEVLTSRIHPDNRDMAESLARAFRIDAMGVDFITEDISRSWRESPCAVIEVNATPGLYTLSEAEKVLMSMFPPANGGRIPSVLVIESHPNLAPLVATRLDGAGLCVGQAYPSQTLLRQHPRGKSTDTLQARVISLIADPLCEAIIVATSEEDIIRHGLPLDRFDLALIPRDLSSNSAKFIQSYCPQVEMFEPGQEFNASLETSLNQLVSQ